MPRGPLTRTEIALVAALAATVLSLFAPISRVTVSNRTDAVLGFVALEGSGFRRTLGELPPRERTTIWIVGPGPETSLRLSFECGGAHIDLDADVYVPRRTASGHVLSLTGCSQIDAHSDGWGPTQLLPPAPWQHD